LGGGVQAQKIGEQKALPFSFTCLILFLHLPFGSGSHPAD
jgi:hypothetical protein